LTILGATMEVKRRDKKDAGEWFWFALVSCCHVLWFCHRWITSEELQVTISVYNDAEIPQLPCGRRKMEASHVFRQSGIEVKWLNCPLSVEGPETWGTAGPLISRNIFNCESCRAPSI